MDLKFVSMPKEEIEAIHGATLKVLEEVGVRFPDEDALSALESAGAIVDRKNMVARMTERIIKDALEKAPRNVVLYARDPRLNVDLQDKETHFCTSGGGAFIYDLESGERRRSVKVDSDRMTLVTDALSHYDIVQPEVMPSDVPERIQDIWRYAGAFSNTSKHVSCIVGPGTTKEEARDIVEMAACVAGGRDELRRKPIISIQEEPLSPLQYSANDTQMIIEYARHGIPIAIYSLTIGGATAPVTLAGQLVVINAELLAAIALVQSINRGNMVLYGSASSVMDMKTGNLALGAPERAILDVAAVNLARYYGLPSMMVALNTEASMPGTQAAFEKTLTGLPPVLAGANIVLGGATLDGGNTYSFEQLVIDDEICSGIARIARGFHVNDETLAVDVIEEVGIGRHYLEKRHTVRHVLTDTWYPTLYKRVKRSEPSWSLDMLGHHDLARTAKAKVNDILANHKPKPLEKEIVRRIQAIVARAERRSIR